MMGQVGGGVNPKPCSQWFAATACVFVTSLVTSNIIAVKLMTVSGLTLPAGVLLFPCAYICGDVLTEVYGYSLAQRVIWLGFVCNVIAVAAIEVAGFLPPAASWHGQDSYAEILGYAPRLLIASFSAYLVGELSNSFILVRIRVATRGRWLWVRTIGSSLVGEGLDSLLFIAIAYGGALSLGTLAWLIMTQWLAKCTYEAAATPITYLVVRFLRRQEELMALQVEPIRKLLEG